MGINVLQMRKKPILLRLKSFNSKDVMQRQSVCTVLVYHSTFKWCLQGEVENCHTGTLILDMLMINNEQF